MGNHEHPCVVCGENTMTAFNYDCEHRHTAEAIEAAVTRVRGHECTCKGNCWHQNEITRLAKLLMERKRWHTGVSP